MSKKIYLFSLVLLALAFTACSETEETGKYVGLCHKVGEERCHFRG